MPRHGRKPGAKGTPESRRRNGAELRECAVCGAEFWVARWQREKFKNGGKYCSRACKHKGVSLALKGRPKVDGPVRHSAGYVLVWAPDHPRAGRRGRVFEHILVAERQLGRRLRKNEEVHHVNGQRDDNRSENLQVVPKGVHQSLHWQEPAFREAQSKRSRRQIVKRKRDPLTGRLLPND